MEACLQADQRVHLVVQVRDPKQFAKSVMALGQQEGIPGRSSGLSEVHLLHSRGITASETASRAYRLAKYMRLVTKEAKRLAGSKRYRGSETILDVMDSCKQARCS